jgi:hypothetical protein
MDMKPSPSTNFAALGAGVATLIAWAIDEFTERSMPMEVAVALGGIVATLFGYLPLGGRSRDVE